MRVAIVGGGISGLVCLHVLSRHHDVELFEANDYPGGHTHTHDVAQDGTPYAIDTGFIVFNEANYPNFTRLLSQLDVAYQDTSMSFSVRCDASGLEYNGTDLNRIFAQRRNLFRPRFYGMLRDILRFGREAPRLLEENEDPTLSEYIESGRYSSAFRDQYLLPMCSALWSAPFSRIREFPARSIIAFFQNHGMLQVSGRPQWKVICGGSREYVRKLVAPLESKVRLNAPIASVTRGEDHIMVQPVGEVGRRFDHVVLACHSDQALRLLADPTAAETAILGAIPYQANDTCLHTHEAVLPQRRRAWAAWNYRIPQRPQGGEEESPDATVTYNMNILQSVRSRSDFCVTLNGSAGIPADKILRRMNYEHPIFEREGVAAQSRYGEIGGQRTHFCGAYWGHGFHEDGVVSALRVCRSFGAEL